MPKFKNFTILLLLLVPYLIMGQTGKVTGTVTDLETGEPLLGANVIIDGTTLGAATNENGEYFILNVPPGSYSLRARYIGYQEVILQNIKVSVNLTTEADFALPSETYTTETITVVAPKPLINKNVTNSTEIVRREDIENLPIRGVNNLVSKQAGVVSQAGNLYIRGSRADAVAYYVDGVLVNNPVFGGSQAAPITNAIEEIQVQAGGYSAEFGGANGGIISTQTRGGGEDYHFSFEGITDNYPGVDVGEEFLGGYSYGYSELVFTAGGPIIPNNKKIRFFVAGSNTFQRTPARYYREYDFPTIVDPNFIDDTISVDYPNYLLNAARNNYQIQGNLTFEFNPITVRLNSNYTYNENRGGRDWTSLAGINRSSQNQAETILGSMKITHVINPRSFYDVIVNYFNDYYVTMDPYFEHNITAYGDSILNQQLFGVRLAGDSFNQSQFQAYGLTFFPNEIPFNLYRKQRTQSWGGKANFLYQIGKHHEFKTGADFTYYTIRRYNINPFSVTAAQISNVDQDDRDVYNRLDNYGYDIYGNKSDDGLYGAKNPVFAAYYIQDKMEYSDLVINAGLRFDYIDIDSKTFDDPSNVPFDDEDIVDLARMVDVDPYTFVSPRLGFSFPVTDRTVFHAQFGKFVQQSQLRNVYLGVNRISDIIKGGYAELDPVGYGLKPERTTQYEIGFRQQLGESFAFTLTGFYKDIKDQIQARAIYADPSAQHTRYYSLVNGDFSTVKGFEVELNLRRTNRLAATFNYTYSDARGTGSVPNEATRTIWQSPTGEPFFPMQISPLSFNQTHTGAVNLDFRFGDEDGPEVFGSQIFERSGLNLFLTYGSGFNFTRWEGFQNRRTPTELLNQSVTPWTFQLDARLDKSFAVGPLNFNAYIWVINLLNTKNVLDVFNTSGDPYDDGWLTDDQGAARLRGYESYGDEYGEMYRNMYLASIYDATFFGEPRQIRVGLKFEY